jgi:hypothetical protein
LDRPRVSLWCCARWRRHDGDFRESDHGRTHRRDIRRDVQGLPKAHLALAHLIKEVETPSFSVVPKIKDEPHPNGGGESDLICKKCSRRYYGTNYKLKKIITMSDREAQHIQRALKPFFRLMLVIACLGLLASCGGGGSNNASEVNTGQIVTGGSLLTDIEKSAAISEPVKSIDVIRIKSGKRVVKNQLLLTRNETTSDEAASQFIQSNGWQVIGYNQYAQLYQVRIVEEGEVALNVAIELSKKSGYFEYVTLNTILVNDVTAAQVNNDPKLSESAFSWWLDYLQVADALSILPTNPIPTSIGIADGGFRADHSDITFREIVRSDGTNAQFATACPPNISGIYLLCDGFLNPAKERNHGMHVSGIVGMTSNNGTLGMGVAGSRATITAAEINAASDQITAIATLLLPPTEN